MIDQKRFSEFLDEASFNTIIKKSNKLGMDILGTKDIATITHIMNNAGFFHTDSFKIQGVTLHIYVKPADKDVDVLATDSSGTVRFSLQLQPCSRLKSSLEVVAVAAEKCPVTADKIYAALLKKYTWIFVSNHQSGGGFRLWQKLSKIPGISVHGFDPRTNKPYNTGKGMHDRSDTHVDYHHDKLHLGRGEKDLSLEPEMNMWMVASKTPK